VGGRRGARDLVRALALLWPSVQLERRRLYALRDGEASVNELAVRAEVTPSTASQQLRILRHLRFVTTRREGRSILYRLHDGHVAALLDEVRNHLDHATLGWTTPAPRETTTA
jgi:DNA-binding transcriptional ArsR family regulator